MSYIGKININNAAIPTLIGSTLYGICSSSANAANKTVASPQQDDPSSKFINTHFDTFMQGTTIHIKFTQGNTITQNITLAVGTTSAKDVVGMPICDPNTIISFTYDENEHWVANDNVDTNTEYVFKTTYDAITNKVLTESDIGAAAPKGVVTDLENNTSSSDLPTAATVAAYVDLRTAGLSGLTGAMHFKGSVVSIPDATATSTYSNYDAGDVILGPDYKEYVYDKSPSGAESSRWVELGDEGSFLLQSAVAEGTATYIGTNDFTPNTLPTLTVDHTGVSQVTTTESSVATTQYTIPKVTQAGTAMTAAVANGILTLTPGTNTVLDNNNITIHGFNESKNLTIPSVSVSTVYLDAQVHFTQGSAASLNKTDVTVIVPNNSQEGE